MSFPSCSPECQAVFQRNGYLHVCNFFNPDSCLAVCKAIESFHPAAVSSVSSSRSTFIDGRDHSLLQYSGLTYLQKLVYLFLKYVD